ncbi:MAG: energy transducer TonB [Bacteroidota bacterium]
MTNDYKGMNYAQQENNYPKAFAATGVILVLIAALCYFLVFGPPPPVDEGTGGLLVNYGTTEEGMGTDYMNTQEPSMAEKANNTKPDKVTPTPPSEEKSEAENSNPDVVTQNNEDAPEIATPTKKPTTAVTAKENSKEKPNPKVNANALYQGKTNNATGEGDGTTGTPGNQGKTTGSTLATNYDGTGSGNGGSLNMSQRSFTSRPKIDDDGRHTGKVVVELRVDKNGNVIYARAGARGTTIVDAALLQKCEDAVKNSRLTAADTELQSGNVVFVFKVN